jgi:hypothetical protein
MHEQNEKHEKKTLELKKLETQFLQQKDETEKKKIEGNIKKKKAEVAKLAATLVNWEQITALTLQVTTLMIKAGKRKKIKGRAWEGVSRGKGE